MPYAEDLQNLALNRLTKVIPGQFALADCREDVFIQFPAGNTSNQGTGRSVGGASPESGAQVTPCRTVDRVVSDASLQRVDLIKIDVEGQELRVLRGATDTLQRFRPHVVFEVEEGNWRVAQNSYEEAIALLEGLGYDLYLLGRAGIGPLPARIPLSANIIAVPRVA